ncbi:hypothetical protein Ae201684_003233 [Aphanomyces euteiches]|uniref:Protein kinase domain-containing protein n=1 Tax=Aphanomyces euteiches TaxID=100861 RepID=A0A6G0XM62_9STRA|nr:hypothetical protein Ae201684_003233 [Aphanomyces euteiches]KAH9131590.1 hypothetical protein AeRB84_021752 [Aphanomyces euteiches]
MGATWLCLEEDSGQKYISVQRNTQGDVECAATAEEDACERMETVSACRERLSWPRTRQITCGLELKRKTRGQTTGYDDVHHWCSVALRMINSTDPRIYACRPSRNAFVALRLNEQGLTECFSMDGTTCLNSTQSIEDCQDRLFQQKGPPSQPIIQMLEVSTWRRLNNAQVSVAPGQNLSSDPARQTITPPSGRVSTTLIVVISVFVACVVLGTWLGIVMHKRRRAQHKRKMSRAYAELMEFSEPPLNLSFLDLYRIDPRHLSVTKPIGSGYFTDVFLGVCQGKPVAVKTLHEIPPTRREVKAFAEGIQLMAMVHSPFIVEFIGACWETPEDLQCVVEYMDSGSLREYLASDDGSSFPWEDKLQYIQSIAEGLHCLHSFPIIHRSLNSFNVLIDTVKGVKLADFGLVRDWSSQITMQGVDRYRWMAPEIITSKKYSPEADIYSFGLLLTEFDTHCVPFAEVKSTEKASMFLKFLTAEAKVTFSADAPTWLVKLGLACVHKDPKMRPTISTIVKTLRSNITL